jgi:outer membrane receptor protein involved in Fe transport
LTYHVTSDFQVTAGVRSFDDKSVVNVHQETGLYASIFDSSNSRGEFSESKTIFKGNASWRFAPNNQLYGTVAQGYRRGGSNGTPTTGNFAEDPAWTKFRADTDIDYELGVKGATQAGLTYNADVFFVDWTHPQINSATTNWGFFAVQNGDKAQSKGIELQLNGTIGTAFHYGLGYTYTDAHLTSDAVAADGTYTINTKGAQLPGVPKNTFNLSGSYVVHLAQGTLTVRADGYNQSETQDTLYSASIFKNHAPPPSDYTGQPKYYYPMQGFWLWNASTTYATGSWDATLWIKNIGNNRGVTGVYTPAYMGTAPNQNYYGNGSKALITLPRTVGLTMTYRF